MKNSNSLVSTDSLDTISDLFYPVSLEVASMVSGGLTMYTGVARYGEGSSGWTLLTGTGSRSSTYHVRFPRAYTNIPKVSLGIDYFDILDGANHRLTANVHKVYKEGFDLRFNTWSDTKVWGAGVNWLSFGT